MLQEVRTGDQHLMQQPMDLLSTTPPTEVHIPGLGLVVLTGTVAVTVTRLRMAMWALAPALAADARPIGCLLHHHNLVVLQLTNITNSIHYYIHYIILVN